MAHQPSLPELLQLLTSPTPDPSQAPLVSRALTHRLSENCVSPLTHVLFTHSSPAVRALAAVCLRRQQARFLTSLPSQELRQLAAQLLERLRIEPDVSVRRALVALVQLLRSVDDLVEPLVSPVVDALVRAPDPQLRVHAFQLARGNELLRVGLADPEPSVRNAALSAYALATVSADSNLIPLLPLALAHSRTVSTDDLTFPRSHALLFEALTNLLPLAEFRPHFADAFRHAVQLFWRAPFEAAIPAVEFLVEACAAKPKSIRKASLHGEAVRAACGVLIAPEETGLKEGVDDDLEEDRVALAMRLLDALATKPELSTPSFVEAYSAVVSSMTNPSTQALKGCFHVIAAVADGCTSVVTSHAEDVVTRVLSLPYEDRMDEGTKMASLDALKAVAEALDTDEMPDDVTSQIAKVCLEAVVKGLKYQSDSVKRAACKALEPVLGLFGSGELDGRIEQVVDALAAFEGSIAAEALLAIGTIVENASDALVESQRFQVLLRRTVEMMVSNSGDDDMMTAAAFEAAGSLVSVCKNVEVVKLLTAHAVHGLESEEPTVKQGAFAFFGNLADAVGGASLMYAERVLRCAVDSGERQDIFVVTDEEGNEKDLNVDNTDEADVENGTVGVRTAYLDEKMLAIACMGAFGTAAGTDEWMNGLSSLPDSGISVLQLLQKCSELADTMTSHFHSGVRSAAFRACCRLASGNVRARTRKPEFGFCSEGHEERVLTVVNEGLTSDDDLWVVTDLLQGYSFYLTEIPPAAILTRKDNISETLSMLIAGKTTCQAQTEDEDLPIEITGDEIDSLIEAIGDVVEALARALRGHFAQHFTGLLDQILQTFYRPAQSGRSRGMVLGAVAGVLSFMSWERCGFPPPNTNDGAYELALSASDDLAAATLPMALEAIHSGDSRTLQRNAMFLLGVIFEHTRSGKSDVWAQLPTALETLQRILTGGKSGNGALVDNAAGAVARIVTSKGIPPSATCNRESMLHAALGCIPLEDDPVENTTVARAIIQTKNSVLEEFLQSESLVRVVSCFTSAVLLHVETGKKKGISRWVNSEADPNDEMVRLDDRELASVVDVLRRIREVHGDAPFTRLGVSKPDALILAGIMGGW